MKDHIHQFTLKNPLLVGLASVILLVIVGLGGYRFYVTYEELQSVKTELKKQSEENVRLTLELSALSSEKENLTSNLEEEKEKNESFEGQIKEIAGTVGTLEKLSKTDKELLQKYSKVYFLNEHYVPSELSEIDEKYLLNSNGSNQIHSKVLPFLKDLMDEAEEDDINLQIVSAYRSFREQASLKNGYKFTYGSGANQFSADQGYSEHQLGTTIDVVGKTTSGALTTSFETTPEYKWLTENAHKFGFVLSYPKGNAYYQFEPWHWRFVGVDLARKLHREKKYFYDLDQREIDQYLVKIFD